MNHSYLSDSEESKVYEITNRLRCIVSPVLRLQAILQFSMIVDTLMIGDSAKPLQDKLMNDVDTLESKVNEYKSANLIGGEGVREGVRCADTHGTRPDRCDSELLTA